MNRELFFAINRFLSVASEQLDQASYHKNLPEAQEAKRLVNQAMSKVRDMLEKTESN